MSEHLTFNWTTLGGVKFLTGGTSHLNPGQPDFAPDIFSVWLSAGKRCGKLRKMLSEHDQDVLPRCPRLGHELTFGYCRQETRGRPCRLILDCWWERFDVRTFLQANLAEEAMAQVERAGVEPPPSKVLSLVDLIQQAKERIALETPDAEQGRKPEP